MKNISFLENVSSNIAIISTVIAVVLIFLFRPVMRKIIGADKHKRFSYNHVNSRHKKYEWIIRISFICLMVILFIVNMIVIGDGGEPGWYLKPYVYIFVFAISIGSLQAYMQWRYQENRRNYQLTLLELSFATVVVLILFTTNFFGAFN